MRYITACSGIEAPTLAWHPLGWQPLAFSEIDQFPRAVLKHHYPTVPLHGDLTAVDWSEYRGRAELFAAGTPCQAFSIAGLRKGLADPRGNLTLAWLGAVDAARPRWLVWENVPGILSHDKGRTFGAFLGALGELGYGFAYRVLDAQYFKLAQRRSRVFLVGYLGDWRPAAAVLFERQSLSGHPAPRRQARARVAGSVNGVSPGGGWRIGSDEAAAGQLIAGSLGAPAAGPDDNDARDGRLIAGTINANGKAAGSATQRDAESGMLVAGTLEASAGRSRGAGTPPAMLAFGGNDTRGSIDVATAVNAHGGPHGRLDFESETFIAQALRARDGAKGVDSDCTDTLIAHSLRADGFDASEDGTGRGIPLIAASNPAPGDTAGTLAKGGHAPAIAFSAKDHGADAGELAPTLRALGHRDSHANGGGQVAVAFQSKASASRSMNPSDISPGIDVGKSDGLSTFAPGYGVRRLTPRECERLMGMPDDFTAVPVKRVKRRGNAPSGYVEIADEIWQLAADGPRYKAIGNSQAVPCLRWIGERIEAVDRTLAERA